MAVPSRYIGNIYSINFEIFNTMKIVGPIYRKSARHTQYYGLHTFLDLKLLAISGN